MKSYAVYIMASGKNGTLYVGVTNNLKKRVYEHKDGLVEGFTQQYKIHSLVYYEMAGDIKNAIIREKQIKKWKQAWKLRLIEEQNPEWHDLYDEL